MQIGHERIVLDPGREVTVMNGTPHRFWNAGAEEVVFRTEIRPALQFESLVGTMFGLAEEGKTNRRGMPNPLRLAVVARAHFDTVRLRKDGTEVPISPRRVMVFKPSAILKQRINGSTSAHGK